MQPPLSAETCCQGTAINYQLPIRSFTCELRCIQSHVSDKDVVPPKRNLPLLGILLLQEETS